MENAIQNNNSDISVQHTTFKIHPGIGIARLGNMDSNFYLAPEQPGALPIECKSDGTEKKDAQGNPKRVSNFKDPKDPSKIRKQAARFKIFAYSEDDEEGAEVKVGGTYKFITESAVTAPTIVEGIVTDIEWTVHLANKKASWYEFQETDGMEGYSPTHALRNPTVVQPDLRRQLIIDPGPVTVDSKNSSASFSKFAAAPSKTAKVSYPQTFPPSDILPNPIETLGSVMVNKQDDSFRLIVLGGNGNSGSTKTPVITSFVNNDGWFDDISDGPVTAKISFEYIEMTFDGELEIPKLISSSMDVQVPAWCVVGYPRFVPEMEDMITMDEKMFDLFVRNMAYQPSIYGVAPYNKEENSPQTQEEMDVWKSNARFNKGYYPKFWEEIWPILRRPDEYKYVYDFDYFGGSDPHNTGTGGNLSKDALSIPPIPGQKDKYLQLRLFIYSIMRKTNQRNEYEVNTDYRSTSSKSRLMPMLCGNNPLSNTSPDKFLSLTEVQLFFLHQWAQGKFVNECQEWKDGEKNCENPWANPPTTGIGIDRGVLSNVLGGAFCPGGELSWIVDNPAIYSQPYRIKHATYIAGGLSIPKPIADIDGSAAPNLAEGLEPGDLTKYIGIPWQADFHECTNQPINITYEEWNNIYLDSIGDPIEEQIAFNVPWWPAHRPVVVPREYNGPQVYWASGLPANKAGDLQMVQAWKDMPFMKAQVNNGVRGFFPVERNDAALGPWVEPGQRILGQVAGKTKN